MEAETNSKWHDKPEVKKGDLGEEIGEKRVLARGWQAYGPVFDGPHIVDRVYIRNKPRPDGSKFICVDFKCKELRKLYPDTGFPLRNYNHYVEVDETIPVVIMFVDYIRGEIYGNNLKNLTPHMKIEKGIVYFPHDCMLFVDTLTPEEIQRIKIAKERVDKDKVDRGESCF